MEAKSLALSLLLMLVAPAAWADTPDWYLGLSLGDSDYSSIAKDAAGQNGPCNHCTNYDATAIGLTVLGGYRFDSHSALEAQVFDLGNGTAGGSQSSVSGISFNESTGFKAVGFGLDAVERVRLNDKAELFGKLGLLRTRLAVNTAEEFDNHAPGGFVDQFNSSVTATKTGYELGIGVEVAYSQRWHLRLGYTQIRDVGASNPDTGQGNVGFLYIAALRYF